MISTSFLNLDTYYEGQNVERFLKHTMKFLYARTILELLNDVVKENCYGCEVDHPRMKMDKQHPTKVLKSFRDVQPPC
jgi:hypothetical protein